MFGLFRSKPRCPVDSEMRKWIDIRWAWLEDQFGLERLLNGRVILPNQEYFPDSFHHDEKSAHQILGRVCGYMDIDPAVIRLSFYEDCNPVYEGRWRKGTAGLYYHGSKRFRIWVEVRNLDNPLALVSTFAHELGHVHLLGYGRISDKAEDHEPLTDLLTVYFGMGVFSANSVIQEQSFCSIEGFGWSMGRQGYLGMSDYGYAFARFARARNEDGKAWASELRLDVRSAFKQAMRFLADET
ncbi:MAG: hypothetical protein PVH19_02415 [Planctomycetia bacterium]|jgi:hypothetical protein